VVLLEELPVHSGLVVEARQERLAHQVREVSIALRRFGKKRQVVGPPLAVDGLPRLAVVTGSGCDVGFHAENRLQAVLDRLRLDLERAEHVPVIGDGHGRHAVLQDVLDQVLRPVRAVEERVLGVEMQVDEVGRHACRILGVPRADSEGIGERAGP
jgi:hypothetical protein